MPDFFEREMDKIPTISKVSQRVKEVSNSEIVVIGGDQIMHHEGYLSRKNIIGRKYRNFFFLQERQFKLLCAKSRSQLVKKNKDILYNISHIKNARDIRDKDETNIDTSFVKMTICFEDRVQELLELLSMG